MRHAEGQAGRQAEEGRSDKIQEMENEDNKLAYIMVVP